MGRRSKSKLLLSFLSFPGRGDRAPGAHAASAAIEQLLVCGFQDLLQKNNQKKQQQKSVEGGEEVIRKNPGHVPTWNEHMRVSSTLIMAPALSNSPQ